MNIYISGLSYGTNDADLTNLFAEFGEVSSAKVIFDRESGRVGSHLPAELRKLAEIAHNLWWTWNDDAKKLYCDLDSELWKEVEQNPVLFLERINYEKLVALAHDENFVYKKD